MVVAAVMLGAGEGVASADPTTAARELQAVADILTRQKQWQGLLYVAYVFLTDEVVPQDRARAHEYVRAAARGGDSRGEALLGLFDAGIETPRILSGWYLF
jgi:TPR repeat protein